MAYLTKIIMMSFVLCSILTLDPGLPPKLFPGDKITNNNGGFWTLPSGKYAIIERQPFATIQGEQVCAGDENDPSNVPCYVDREQVIDSNKAIWTNRWHLRVCGDPECMAERLVN